MVDRRRTNAHSGRSRFLTERRGRKKDRRQHHGITRFLYIGMGSLWTRLLASIAG